jgi:hypothetical protein
MYVLRAAVLIGALGYLYQVLFYSQDFDALVGKVKQLQGTRYLMLPLVSALMVANWGFEAFKWQYLLKAVYPVSRGTAFKAVLSGVSVSALLPNRVAEYLGRIFYIPAYCRIKAIIVTIVGSMAQLLVSIVLGSLAFIAYQYYPFEAAPLNLYILLVLILLLNILLLLGYFNIPLIVANIPDQGYFRKVAQYLRLVTVYHPYSLWKVLQWAGLRYAVFAGQFYLLLYTFQVPVSLMEGAIALPVVFLAQTLTIALPVVFLAQTLIPTIALAEVGIRGATAVHFIVVFGGSEVGILAATYSLWLINILLPALLVALFVVFTHDPEAEAASDHI